MSSIARKHRTDAKTLRRELRGDLDWIVLKAIEEFRQVAGDDSQTASGWESLASVRQSMTQPALAHQARLEAIKLRLASLNSQLAARPKDAVLWSERAFLNSRLGQDQNALEDFNAAVELDPTSPFLLYYLALQRLYTGDAVGYRQTAGQMMLKFGQSENRQIAGRVAIACLVASPPVGEIDRLTRIADVAAGPGDTARGNARWIHVAKVLAEYSAGRYAAARARGNTGFYTPTTVELLSAMIQYRAGAAAVARDAYRQMVQRMNAELLRPEMTTSTINLSDYVVCQIIRREADATFAAKPTTRPTTRPVAH